MEKNHENYNVENQCSHSCSSCDKNCQGQRTNITDKINNIFVILSGKGGVGKSTVAASIANSLAKDGKKVGLLDIDIHGPSIPTIFNITNAEVVSENGKMQPVLSNNIKIMSIGFLLQNNDDPVIFRGPMKSNVIKQFIEDVNWGELDYLIVDSPPGTGDEQISIFQLLPKLAKAILVTTPQEISAADVRKSVNFCRKLNVDIVGILENMSGFVCPSCGSITNIFGQNAGQQIAEKFSIPFLGKIPVTPQIYSNESKQLPSLNINLKHICI